MSSVAASRLAYRFPQAERWLDGEPTPLIEDGRLIPAAARSERITVREIEAALRRQGLERIEQVRRAVVETDGEITIVPRDA